MGKAKEVREGHVRNIFIVHGGVLWHDKSGFAVQKYEKHWGMESVRDVKLEVGVTFIKDMLKKIQGFV